MEEHKAQELIHLSLEQYICPECTKKFYINQDDQPDQVLGCPFCCTDTKNIRKFEVGIKEVIDKE